MRTSSAPKPNPRQFAPETGLAFGTFRRYVYAPFKAGQQLKGAAPKRSALARAKAAALVALHSADLAKQSAKATAALKKLVAPLTDFEATLSSVAVNLRGGHLDRLDIQSANGLIASIEKLAKSSGITIKETTPPNAP